MLRASGLGLISSMRLDDRKDIQYVKPAWSECIQSFKPASFSLSRGMIKDVKHTHTHTHTHTHSSNNLSRFVHQLLFSLNLKSVISLFFISYWNEDPSIPRLISNHRIFKSGIKWVK